MRRRKMLIALVGLTAVVTAVVELWPQPTRVTLENFQRIREGMSHSEVEAILGPPGDYTTHPVTLPNGKKDPFSDTPLASYRWGGNGWWSTDDGGFLVAFDRDQVLLKNHYPYVEVHQGTLERVIWRLKRQWRRWFP